MEEKKEFRENLTPTEAAHQLCDGAMRNKAYYGALKTFVLAIAAGAFIAFGAQITLTAITGGTQTCWGLVKLVGGMTFTTGLIMVLLTGAELFTGNILMTFSLLEKKITLLQLLKNWTIVYFGNFIGALILILLLYYGGIAHYGSDAVGVTAIQTAYSKLNLSFTEAFCRGILCNWLVCLAVYMASTTKSVSGKIMALFFPITAFAASGFEHSVANVFFIPNAILTKNISSVALLSGFTAEQLAGINFKAFLVNNLIPVTLGNIAGAVIFVVIIFWIAYFKAKDKTE